jgi:hypothetical protein
LSKSSASFDHTSIFLDLKHFPLSSSQKHTVLDTISQVIHNDTLQCPDNW